jgi:hypothetical protein
MYDCCINLYQLLINCVPVFKLRSCWQITQTLAGGPPLAGCPRLLIQYIRSSPHIGGRSSNRNLSTRLAVVTGTHYSKNSVWNNEEEDEWKESIIVPIYKKGDKPDCIKYRDISLLSTTYKILSSILLSRLTPYAEEIIRNHQCGFRHNRSTTNHTICIPQIREKKWE